MPGEKEEAQYSEVETEQRLRQILQGAFRKPPVPLKEVPKKNGTPRGHRKVP